MAQVYGRAPFWLNLGYCRANGVSLSNNQPKFEYLKQVLVGVSGGTLALALAIWGISATSSAPAATPTATETPTTKPTTDATVCSLKDVASDPKLGTFTGQVIDLATGDVLYDQGGITPSITASSVKVVAAAASMQALGPNFKISTKVVYSPSKPDTVVLVGGGDPTLSRKDDGSSVYRNAPKLSDLAKQVQAWAKTNNILEIKHIVLDTSLFTGSTWDTTWPNSELTEGYQPQITALMVDGDRRNPAKATSPRSTDPVGRAGREFKTALGTIAATADISNGLQASGSTKIAEVKSASLPTLINYMLSASDNTIAEYLGRHVALSQGFPANLQSIQPGYQKALASLGLDWAGVVIKDGSGESNLDVIPPAFFNELTAKVLGAGKDLRSIFDALPVAGKSGSLASRFTGDNDVARGHVFAKTGWIFHAYSLVGYLDAKDGSKLAFAFFASGPATSDATKQAIDTVTTQVYNCGLELSNK